MHTTIENGGPRSWWTVRQMAEHYGLSVRSVYDAVQTGALVAHRFGTGRGGIRISDHDRLEWERRCRQSNGRPAARRSRPLRPVNHLVRKHFGR